MWGMRGCEVVQGHACGEGGREHGRCRRVWPEDSAPHEARSGLDVFTCGYSCLRGVKIRKRLVPNAANRTRETHDLSTMRAASSSEPLTLPYAATEANAW
jgi:hypothetical protein